MVFAALILATLLFVELFLRLRILSLAGVPAKFAQRSARIIQATRISDHWKERVLPAYSQRLFLSTLRLLGALVLAFSPFVVALIAAPFLDIPLAEELVSLRGIAISTGIALVYVFVRKRLVSG